MLSLRTAVDALGGPERAARVCEVSSRALYKWLLTGTLPRTEYTGETRYAEKMAAESKGAFSADDLRAACKRQPESAA